MAGPDRNALIGYAQRMALKYGLDPDIFVRQINQESGFNPDAKNPSGATGIAQLMPQYYPNAGQDPYADLESAAQTDAANLKRFGGDQAKMLAAYNAGAGAVEKYGGVPPYQETQTYVQNILGGGGQTFMAQNQDQGTGDLSALVDAAINGDQATGGFVPDGSIGTVADNSPVGIGGTSDAGSVLDLVIGQKGSPIRVENLNPKVKDTSLAGSVMGGTVPNKEPTYRYWFRDGTYLDGAALNTGLVIKGGTALKALASGGGTPRVETFPDKSLRQYDPNTDTWKVIGESPQGNTPKTITTKAGSFSWDPNSGQWTLIPGTEPPGARVQIHQMPDGSLLQYDPDTGQWQTIQPRYVDPTEQAYKQALTAEAQANTLKTQQSLRPVALKAIEDAFATVAAIQNKLQTDPSFTPQEATSLMTEVHKGLAATLAGTTIFEQQKQQQDTDTQRAQIANSLLNQRVSSASSLGQSLFNAAVGHVLLPKGQKTLGIDPLAIANQEVNTMGGGAQLGQNAASFLSSLFGQGGPGGSPAPGGPASSFPTTRDAVLAAYPHLGAPTSPAPTPPSNPAPTAAVPAAAASTPPPRYLIAPNTSGPS